MNKPDPNVAIKKKPRFTTFIIVLGIVVLLTYYTLSYLRFTDNGFVVQISTPLAPRVSGFVTEVHVKNGQTVKAGDPLVSLDPEIHQIHFDNAKAQYQKAVTHVDLLEKQIETTRYKLKSAISELSVVRNQYQSKSHPSVRGGIPQIDLFDLKSKVDVQINTVESIKNQLEVDKLNIQSAKENADSLKFSMASAKLTLDYTTVRAPTNGYVENIFLGIGTQVSPSSAMFTLINDAETYIQANFEETDLAGVKAGDKATIYPRTYFGTKSFEGVVVSLPFGVARQLNEPFAAMPIVQTENKWLLLPQRLPVIIKVTNLDKEYPLINGMSTYVRLQH